MIFPSTPAAPEEAMRLVKDIRTWVENLRVPQNSTQAGWQVLTGSKVLEQLTQLEALLSRRPAMQGETNELEEYDEFGDARRRQIARSSEPKAGQADGPMFPPNLDEGHTKILIAHPSERPATPKETFHEWLDTYKPTESVFDKGDLSAAWHAGHREARGQGHQGLGTGNTSDTAGGGRSTVGGATGNLEDSLPKIVTGERPAPGMKLAGIYVASRVRHAAMWQGYKDRGLPIISSWINEAGDGDTDDFGELWTRIESEIRRCRALIFYGQAGDDPWKGAFIEIGLALAYNKPVFVVLNGIELRDRTMRPVGSWLAHPNVTRLVTLDAAFVAVSPTVPSAEKGEG